MSVGQKCSQHFGTFIESRTQERLIMAKGGQRGGQPPEGEPGMGCRGEETDPEVMRNLVAAMQAEVAVIKANE